MVPFGTKALLGMAALGVVAAVLYGLITDDSTATTLLIVAVGGAGGLAALVLLADPDRAPWFAPDTPLSQEQPAGGRPSLPSAWPLVGAVALGVLALAAATNAVLVVTAGILMAVVGIGWLFQQFSEHPTYTARYAARLKERLVLPIGLPVGVILLVAVIAISLSRVFLALPENGTRVAALVVAVVLLTSGFVIAASERMARTALVALSAFAFACLVAAGIAGLNHGERKFEKPKPIPHAPLPAGINPTITQGTTANATSGAGQGSNNAAPQQGGNTPTTAVGSTGGTLANNSNTGGAVGTSGATGAPTTPAGNGAINGTGPAGASGTSGAGSGTAGGSVSPTPTNAVP